MKFVVDYPIMIKTCTLCRITFPATLDNFPPRSIKRCKDGFDNWCRSCHCAKSMERYRNNKVEINERKKPYWKKRYLAKKADRESNRPPNPVGLLSDVELSYMAGLIDGEGCLTITKLHSGGVTLSLSIQMTDQGVLNWIATKLGTKCNISRSASKVGPRRKPLWKVILTGGRAAMLCSRILPYMKVKHRQATIFLRFAETFQTGYDSKGVPQHILNFRSRCKLAIHLLNRRGVTPLPEEEAEFQDLWDATNVSSNCKC